MNLKKYLQILTTLGALFDLIAGMMERMEKTGAPGASKKEAVLAFIEGLLGESSAYVKEITPELIEGCKGVAGAVIEAIHRAFSVIGIFTKGGEEAD